MTLLLKLVLITLVFLSGVMFFTEDTSGHIRYVLNQTEIARAQRQPRFPLPVEGVGAMMLSVFLAVAGVQFMGLYVNEWEIIKKIKARSSSVGYLAPLILRVLTGVFLLMSGLSGRLLSPTFEIQLRTLTLPSLLQIAAGSFLILGLLTELGAALLIVSLAISFSRLGVYALDFLVLLGVGLFLMLEDLGPWSVDSLVLRRRRPILASIVKRKGLSLVILRVTFGISLIWLGLTEKLLAPELTAVAITKYNVPYFPELELFVFLFGIFEIVIGFHFLLGMFERLVSLIYLGLLVSAIQLFGETVQHLPLFGVAIVFMMLGAGPWRVNVSLSRD